ncbi:MAG: Fur family transcriptional regulator [Dehalococcoidia bacterium]
MARPRTTEELEAIEARLQAGGFRLTSPRRRVLEAMQELGDHVELDALVRAVPTASRSTVFRTVRLLRDLDLACRVTHPGAPPAYRLSTAPPHHHASCRSCGELREVASERLERTVHRLATSLGYALAAYRLDLIGRCANCH